MLLWRWCDSANRVSIIPQFLVQDWKWATHAHERTNAMTPFPLHKSIRVENFNGEKLELANVWWWCYCWWPMAGNLIHSPRGLGSSLWVAAKIPSSGRPETVENSKHKSRCSVLKNRSNHRHSWNSRTLLKMSVFNGILQVKLENLPRKAAVWRQSLVISWFLP